MEPPILSIIVPIYNVEEYLSKCIDSILQQSFTNFELILIDDGSSDQSGKIIDEYAKQNKNIIAIHQTNHGYGYTMNQGINIAKGKYIGIIEPDDFIAPDMYAALIEAAEQSNADIVKSPYLLYYNHNKESHMINWNRDYIFPNSVFKITEFPILLFLHPSIWSCIYKKDFIKNNHIKFIEPKGAGWADNLFQVQTLCLATKIKYITTPYYFYRKHFSKDYLELRNTYSIPFIRSLEVNQWIHNYGITNKDILACLYKREIVYAKAALKAVSIKNLHNCFKLTKKLMNSMNRSIICNNSYISVKDKDFYFRFTKNTILWESIYFIRKLKHLI